MPGYLTAVVTFLMAAGIIYLSYLCSKYLGKGLAKTGRSRYMRMVDQMVVGQNRTLAIVQVGDRYLLLGAGQEQVQTLAELSEEDLVPRGGNEGEPAVDFGQLFTRLSRKKDGSDREQR